MEEEEDTPVQQLNRECEPPPKGGGSEVANTTEGKVADESGSMVQRLGVVLHQHCGKEEAWQHRGCGRQVSSESLLPVDHIGEDGQCRSQLDLTGGVGGQAMLGTAGDSGGVGEGGGELVRL